MWDSNHLRYYSEGKLIAVRLENVDYFVSNHWTAGNKRLFFDWLSQNTRRVCRQHWSTVPTTPRIPTPPTVPAPSKVLVWESSLQTLINKIETLEKVNLNLCYLIPQLQTQINDLTKQVEYLNRELTGN